MVIAKKEDWNIEPMPENHDTFLLERHFSEKEINNLRLGHIPQEMEDKWFYYYEDDKLYAHRSWTGTCIYIINFDFESNKHQVIVNRDREKYANADDVDKDLLNGLLDFWTQDHYDYYREFVDETVKMIHSQKNN